jgi:hypothetical protein
MPQICHMLNRALLPFRRKACCGFCRLKNPTVSAGFETVIMGTRGQHAAESDGYSNVVGFYIVLVVASLTVPCKDLLIWSNNRTLRECHARTCYFGLTTGISDNAMLRPTTYTYQHCGTNTVVPKLWYQHCDTNIVFSVDLR